MMIFDIRLRLWIAIAVVIAALIATITFFTLPTEERIEADTARNALWAVRLHYPKYQNLTLQEIQRRHYRGLTNEQITARVRKLAQEQEKIASIKAPSSVDTPGGPFDLRPSLGANGEWTLPPDALLSAPMPPLISTLMEEVDKKRLARRQSLRSDQFQAWIIAAAAWIAVTSAAFLIQLALVRRKRRSHRRQRPATHKLSGPALSADVLQRDPAEEGKRAPNVELEQSAKATFSLAKAHGPTIRCTTCGGTSLTRIQRAFWRRLLRRPGRRFKCIRCGRRFSAPVTDSCESPGEIQR